MVYSQERFQSVLDQYEGMGLNVKGVDASQRFYDALAGVTDPELKTIGNAIEVLMQNRT
jgi:GMP synthase (glutamine-hydrolysing)